METQVAQARAWHGQAGAPPSAAASQLFGSRVALTSVGYSEGVNDHDEDSMGRPNQVVRVAAFLATRNEVRHVIATASLASAPPTSSGVPKPEGFASVTEKPAVVPHGHRAEIQHVAFSHSASGTEGWLGSTDGRGATVVSRFSLASLASHTGEGSLDVLSPLQSISLPPPSPIVEWGWSGLAFNPSSEPSLVRVNHFGRSLEWFEEDRCVRRVHTLGCPTQAGFVRGHPNLVAVSEGNDLSLWDLRSSEKNGCTKRITVAGGPLHGLAVGEGKNAGAIAVGGAGRSVTLVDTRKWTPRNRATNLTKYEISSVHLSSVAEDVCYAGGVDSEVVCRNVGAKVSQKKENPEKIYGGGHYDGFRGDGRWVGLQCANLPASSSSSSSSSASPGTGGEEVLVGHTELGSLYLLLRPNVLATLS